jgi:hypothetical protein
MKKIRFVRPQNRSIGLLSSKEEESQLRKKWAQEDDEKINLLGESFGLNPDDPEFFKDLALTLARHFYPESRKRGRANKWTELNRGVLVVEVERLKEQSPTKSPLKTLCYALSEMRPWSDFLERQRCDSTTPDPGAVLTRMYQDSKTLPMTKALRTVYRVHRERGSLSDWEKFVWDAIENPHPN